MPNSSVQDDVLMVSREPKKRGLMIRVLMDWEKAEIWPALASRVPRGHNASKDSLVSSQFLCGIEALLSWSTKSPLGQFPGGGLHGPLTPAPLGYMPSLSP